MKKKIIFLSVLLVLVGLPLLYVNLTIYAPPSLAEDKNYDLHVDTLGVDTYTIGPNWLRKNAHGNWESYIEGDAYERGQTIGTLHEQLIKHQEKVFVDEINKTLPNAFYRRVLLYGVAWFNRDLDESLPLEYRQELYGVSQHFADSYDYIGPKYNRVISYHAAHDIGHMAQNMNLVACSTIARWQTTNGETSLLLARNFDFYFGDEFAENKIVLFVNPDLGYKFVSITWGGFSGVVSGMNEKGLSVTLNALPSELPSSSATPVSIIARIVLQYASNITEALEIISQQKVFVSESFTIASAEDKIAVVIEKTPDTTDVYYPPGNALIVTNHFQGAALANSTLNLNHLAESDSEYRYQRLEELLTINDTLSPQTMLGYLRERNGLQNEELGFGNPMAINQLIAHHGVVFDVMNRIAYVSNIPYQEGVFTAYKLNEMQNMATVVATELTLPADDFLKTSAYAYFNAYKQTKDKLLRVMKNQKDSVLPESFIEKFIALNPNYYEGYKLVGDYYFEQNKTEVAKKYYLSALKLPIPYASYKKEMQAKIKQP